MNARHEYESSLLLKMYLLVNTLPKVRKSSVSLPKFGNVSSKFWPVFAGQMWKYGLQHHPITLVFLQMSANSGSIGSRNGPLAESPCNAKNGVDHTSNGGQKRIPLYRSRTDSVITYTPPSIGEAPGSTFYIRKNGQIDYMVLLKVTIDYRIPS